MEDISKRLENLSPLKRALFEIEDLRAELEKLQKMKNEKIAIIGMECRFPGSDNTAQFWKVLSGGLDTISEVPKDRWNIDDYYSSKPGEPGKISSRFGGFISDVDKFDADFFGISPREAMSMDPQQRILLEVVWHALENANIHPDKIAKSKTGVFIGISNNDYTLVQHIHTDPAHIDAYHGSGNAFSIAANRISYLLDLRGPSISMDTACSSSLVAVHLACQSLKNNETNMAIAGGVSLILSPEASLSFSRANMLAPGGRCRTFDAKAEGYVRGEGCGVVILKRLTDALKDNDNILALISGTAVNQDGRTNGLTAPNSLAQQAVIREALNNAAASPEEISYIETHGTGTILGDPVEIQSLASVMKDRDINDPCFIGSVKTNIGHLESAAGVAGIIKTVLMLKNKTIPAHLNFENPNPHIPFNELPFRIPVKTLPWNHTVKRKAGINSFGFGGTNAHIVLEEAAANEENNNFIADDIYPLCLSAHDKNSLRKLASDYIGYLDLNNNNSVASISFTANTSRKTFACRFAAASDSIDGLKGELISFINNEADGRELDSEYLPAPALAFLFTGQGLQYPGMGKKLYHTYPVVKSIMDKGDEILEPLLNESILDIMFDKNDKGSLIHKTMYTQPSLYLLEYALATLWISWGVEPSLVMGHSIGELSAAAIAGVFSFEDGLRLVALRGKLMQSLPENGKMLVIFSSLDHVHEIIKPYQKNISVAAVNGPQNIVISGDASSVTAIKEILSLKKIESKELNVSHAFHSSLMDPILEEFEYLAGMINYSKARIPVISNLTGERIPEGEITGASYWRKHIRSTVQFECGMKTLASSGVNVFLEIGPHPSLIGMGGKCVSDKSFAWIASLKNGDDDRRVLSNAMGSLFVRGFDFNWENIYRNSSSSKVSLPLYPFRKERYWFEKSASSNEHASLTNTAEAVPDVPLSEKTKENRSLNYDEIIKLSDEQKIPEIESIIIKELSRILRKPVARLLPMESILNLGMDSITAIELKSNIERTFNIEISVASLIKGPSAHELSSEVLGLITMQRPTAKVEDTIDELKEYPLSYGQSAMWFQHHISPDSIFNPSYAARIRTKLDLGKLKLAINSIINRHQMLRTTFHMKEGKLFQRINDAVGDYLQIESLSGLDESTIRQRVTEEIKKKFNLETGPLFRICIFTLSDDEHILLMISHHIVTDMWSLAVILNELGSLYISSGHENHLPEIGMSYMKFASLQRSELKEAKGERLWNYWSQKLSGELHPVELPLDKTRPAVQTYRGDSRSLFLDENLTAKLHTFSKQSGTTLYTVLLTAFNVLLYRYTGQSDLTIGTPSAGRNKKELLNTVGYFVNPLAIRSSVSGDMLFSQLLNEVRQSVTEALENQDYPFNLLIEKLHPARDNSRTPLFQVMFIYQRAHLMDNEGLSAFALGIEGQKLSFADVTLESINLNEQGSPFDMSLMMAENGNKLAAKITFNTDLFEPETIEKFLIHIKNILSSVTGGADMAVRNIPLMDTQEIKDILSKAAGPELLPEEIPVHILFEKQAGLTPDALALKDMMNEMSYSALNKHANKRAHQLKGLGIKRGDIVAVYLERSNEIIVSILAILKTGAAYLPLDISTPAERVEIILKDSKAGAIITNGTPASFKSLHDLRILNIIEANETADNYAAGNPDIYIAPLDMAYVIYTSGSTGQPKGVEVDHRGLVNSAFAFLKNYNVTESSRVLQFASVSFDASAQEIFMALISGGSLYIVDRETILSPARLIDYMNKNGITHITMPPSMLAILPEDKLKTLRTIVSAGEACTADLAEKFYNGRRFVNAYGPTEASICAAVYHVRGSSQKNTVPIGRPIENVNVYICDKNMNIVPSGIYGEIIIGGMGVARGYLNRPDLTAEKFIPDCFSGHYGSRLYRTGDIGKYLPDGKLIFAGRKDLQVKLRGNRIEIGEIEAVIKSFPGISDVAVIYEKEKQALYAFYTLKDKNSNAPEKLEDYLKKHLPVYMIPSAIIRLEKMPLNINGKIDRKALLSYKTDKAAEAGSEALKPRTEIEIELMKIFEEVLHIKDFGINDNFFDIGGHSLAAVEVQMRIQEKFGRELSILDVFNYPNISSLARYLFNESGNSIKKEKINERVEKQRAVLELKRRNIPKKRSV